MSAPGLRDPRRWGQLLFALSQLDQTRHPFPVPQMSRREESTFELILSLFQSPSEFVGFHNCLLEVSEDGGGSSSAANSQSMSSWVAGFESQSLRVPWAGQGQRFQPKLSSFTGNSAHAATSPERSRSREMPFKILFSPFIRVSSTRMFLFSFSLCLFKNNLVWIFIFFQKEQLLFPFNELFNCLMEFFYENLHIRRSNIFKSNLHSFSSVVRNHFWPLRRGLGFSGFQANVCVSPSYPCAATSAFK